MSKEGLLNNFKKTLEFFQNPRKLGIYFCGFVAAFVGGVALSRIGEKEFLDSLGRAPVTQQPSAVARDSEWAAQFNKKYEKGIRSDSFSHMLPNNPPFEKIVARDILQERAQQALFSEMVDGVQRLNNTVETTENVLNNSVEKQPTKTQRYGVSVGFGATVNLGDTIGTQTPTRVFRELKNLVERLIAIGDIVNIQGLNDEFSDLGRHFLDGINNHIDLFTLPNARVRWRMDLTLLRPNDNLGDFSGITAVKMYTNNKGEEISQPKKLTHENLQRLLSRYGFTEMQITEIASLAPKYCEMGRLLNLAINNHATLAEIKTALSHILNTQPGLFSQDLCVSATHHSPGRKLHVSSSSAVAQIYTPLPATQAQGSVSWDFKNKELCVGVGKSHFLAGKNSRLGFLVGADAHARWQAAPNPGFGGFGLKAFAGPVVNF